MVVLLSINLALAIGIRPAKTTIESEQTKSLSGQFWVVNNDQMDFSAKVYIEGEMSQYITLNTKELQFRSDTDSLPVDFSVNLPSSIPPGTSSANIVVEQALESSTDNVISSKVVLKHKIIVQGPYPEKYIVASVNFHDTGNQIEFVSEVENLGKQDLQEVQTKFYVNDKQQQAQTKETETTSLKTNENKLLKTSVNKDIFDLGEFEVSAITTYDGQQVEVVKKLVVGEPKIEISYFDKFLIANKINQYTLDLLNQWNQEIKNVFVDVEVKKDGQKIDSFRTKSVDLDAEISKRINDYYDARNINPGKYAFDFAVNFWNLVRMEQQIYQFETEFLPEDEFNSIEAKPPQQASPEKIESGLPMIVWIVLSFLGVLLILFGVYVLWRYIHRQEYGENHQQNSSSQNTNTNNNDYKNE